MFARKHAPKESEDTSLLRDRVIPSEQGLNEAVDQHGSQLRAADPERQILLETSENRHPSIQKSRPKTTARSCYSKLVALLLVLLLGLLFGVAWWSSKRDSMTSLTPDTDGYDGLADSTDESEPVQLDHSKESDALQDSFFSQPVSNSTALRTQQDVHVPDISQETPHEQESSTESGEEPADDPDASIGVTGLNWYQSNRKLQELQQECERNLGEDSKLTPNQLAIARADCGAGYTFPKPKAFRIALYGEAWGDETLLRLSGCELGTRCKLNPRCTIHRTTSRFDASRSDVVVVTSFEHRNLKGFDAPGGEHHPYRVVYWRESYWPKGPPIGFQYKNTDLIMGVHLQSELQNPSFRIYPSLMLKGMFLDGSVEKKAFAASLISDCTTSSQRFLLIQQLTSMLGGHRIHQFGKCGTRELPGFGIYTATKFLAKYRFFLAFENSIQKGYTTEKLFWTLLLPLIPVYYGDPDVPNITTTPSFLKVLDYSRTRSLAEHLLFLEANPAEYAKYGSWRRSENPFTTEFLQNTAENFPGPAEMLKSVHRESRMLSARKAICCRLCDEAFLKSKIAKRSSANAIPGFYGPTRSTNMLHEMG